MRPRCIVLLLSCNVAVLACRLESDILSDGSRLTDMFGVYNQGHPLTKSNNQGTSLQDNLMVLLYHQFCSRAALRKGRNMTKKGNFTRISETPEAVQAQPRWRFQSFAQHIRSLMSGRYIMIDMYIRQSSTISASCFWLVPTTSGLDKQYILRAVW